MLDAMDTVILVILHEDRHSMKFLAEVQPIEDAKRALLGSPPIK